MGWDENTRMVSIEEEIKQQETPPENNDTDNSENDNNDENNDNNDNNNNNDDDDIKVDVIEKKEYAKGGTGDIPKKDIGVTDIVIPETKQQEQTFIIQASNEIAKFEEIEGKENEIIIDVYYAQKEILTDHIEVETSDVVSGIVSSQYTDDDDITVTRVVLELKRQCEYDIILEEKDEDSIIVSFVSGFVLLSGNVLVSGFVFSLGSVLVSILLPSPNDISSINTSYSCCNFFSKFFLDISCCNFII